MKLIAVVFILIISFQKQSTWVARLAICPSHPSLPPAQDRTQHLRDDPGKYEMTLVKTFLKREKNMSVHTILLRLCTFIPHLGIAIRGSPNYAVQMLLIST